MDDQNINVAAADNMSSDDQFANMSEDEMLNLFIEQLVVDKNLGISDEDVLAEIRAELKEELINKVNGALIDALPDDKFDELDAKINAGEADAAFVNNLIQESGIEVEKIVQETMLKFREIYLNPEGE